MLNRRHLLGCLLAAPLVARPAYAGCGAVQAVQGYAIGGVDPTGYFRDGRVVMGTDAHRLMWHNAVWRFASRENMLAFESDPWKSAPQYGGFCALTLSEGAIAPSVPEAWAIHGDKLYLTKSLAARAQWLQDPANLILKADSHWKTALCW